MRSVAHRVHRLEGRFEMAKVQWHGYQVVVSEAGVKLALDSDRCLKILDECGFLRHGPFFNVVKFLKIPDGLNEQELERFLRKDGFQLTGFGGPEDPNMRERNEADPSEST